MGRPTYDEIKWSLEVLLTCSADWQLAADQIGERAPLYEGYFGSGLDCGLFTPVGLAYQASCVEFAGTVRTADSRMTEVANTLRRVAVAYRADEDRGVHLARKEW